MAPAASGTGVSVLLRQPSGFDRLAWVHVPLHANDAPVAHVDDARSVDHQLGPAFAPLVFALENNDPVACIDELLWLDPVLIPYLVVFRLEGMPDLTGATQDLAFLDAHDRPMKLDARIEQTSQGVPIPAL